MRTQDNVEDNLGQNCTDVISFEKMKMVQNYIPELNYLIISYETNIIYKLIMPVFRNQESCKW